MDVKNPEGESRNLLVIGYGNELRSDDGVGPMVADIVAKWELPGVRVIVCQQLTPEIVIPIADAVRVIFVDAAKNLCAVEARELKAENRGHIMTHACDPQALLQLADSLYGRCPPALWLTVPAEDFHFGHGLSPLCQRGMESALERIKSLAGSCFLGAACQKAESLCQVRRSGLPRGRAKSVKESKIYARSSSRPRNHR